MSTVTVVALCLAYTTAGAVVARLITGHLAWAFYENTVHPLQGDAPDGEQWFGAFLIGAVAGVFWPLSVVCLVRLPAMGAEARGRMRVQQQRIRELEDVQRRRERALEIELGIGDQDG